MLQESLKTYLATDTALAALVVSGSGVGSDRIYGGMAPQSKKPGAYIVYIKVGEYPDAATYCGPSVLQRCVFQFDCYSKFYKESIQVSKALKGALIGFTGLMGDTRIKSVALETEFELLDSEPGLFRVCTSLVFWYSE